MQAKTIYYYYRIYQHFLMENGLQDDSDTITVKDLVIFCEKQISSRDFDRLLELCLEAY